MADVKIQEGLRVETKLIVGDNTVTPTATLHVIGEGNSGGSDNLFYFTNNDASDSIEMNNAGRVTLKTLNSIPISITRPNGNGIMQFRNDANEGSVTYYGDSMPRWGSGVIETEFSNFHYVFGYSPTVAEGGSSPADLPTMDEVMRLKHNGQVELAKYGGTDFDTASPAKVISINSDNELVTDTRFASVSLNGSTISIAESLRVDAADTSASQIFTNTGGSLNFSYASENSHWWSVGAGFGTYKWTATGGATTKVYQEILSGGQLKLHQYTGTTMDGTAAKTLGVTADGTVVTTSGGGGGGDLEDALTSDNSSGENKILMNGSNGVCQVDFLPNSLDGSGKIGSDADGFFIGTDQNLTSFEIRTDNTAAFEIDESQYIAMGDLSVITNGRVSIKDESRTVLHLEGNTSYTPLSNADNTYARTLRYASHGTLHLNTSSTSSTTLAVASDPYDQATNTGTGTATLNNGSSLVSGSGTAYNTELEGGDIIVIDSTIQQVHYTMLSNSFFFIQDDWTGSTTSGLSFSILDGDIFDFKDSYGTTKLSLHENGGLALGVNPTRYRNSFFTIDNDTVNNGGSVPRVGTVYSSSKAAIQIGGSVGDIGNESIRINSESTNDGGIYYTSSIIGNDIHLRYSGGDWGIARNGTTVFKIGANGIQIGNGLSATDAETDLHVAGVAMVEDGVIVGTSVSTSPVIMSGSSNPTSGVGVVAPQGSLYLRTNGGFGSSLYVKSSTANTGWDPLT